MSKRFHRQKLPLLRVFDAVARLESVTKAADELGLTPGAVSQQVRQLEEDLGVALFLREHRRIWLTNEGRLLATTAMEVFERIDATVERIASENEIRKIRFHVMPAFALLWLLPRVVSLYEHYPDIEIEVATANELETINLESSDFAVRLAPPDWKDPNADLLFHDQLVVVCSPALAQEFREPEDLLGQPLIHSMARLQAWNEWFTAQGLSGQDKTTGIRLAHSALTFSAAAKGLGIAVGQYEYVRSDVEAGRLVIPDVGASYRSGRAYFLVHSKRKAHQRNIRMFRKWLFDREMPKSD